MSSDHIIVIPLTQGQQTIIDAVDADLIELKWYAYQAHNGPYYAHTAQKGPIHRIILARKLGRDLLPHPQEMADHIDGNSLNNRRCNLRLATHSQNMRNRKRPVNNTSGYKGVAYRKDVHKWIAYITVSKKLKHLGYFNTPEEAHEAYCEAAKEHYGEFARFD
jgi:hypothetical protein